MLPDSTVKADTRLQKAAHVVAGFEVEASKYITINIEGYIKDFYKITNVNRNKIYKESSNQPDIYTKDFIDEIGLARGIDILGTYRNKNLYIWVAYSLGKITRDDGIMEYTPYFDRRHNLNLVGSYSFGKDKTWEFSLRYNFGTGFPFTPTRTNYSKLNFLDQNNEPDLTYDYTTANGQPERLYGDLYTKRLPNYHRVDVSIKKEFNLKGDQKVEASLGATNILNYENIFYYDRNENKRVNQLPIMPSLSISYSF